MLRIHIPHIVRKNNIITLAHKHTHSRVTLQTKPIICETLAQERAHTHTHRHRVSQIVSRIVSHITRQPFVGTIILCRIITSSRTHTDRGTLAGMINEISSRLALFRPVFCCCSLFFFVVGCEEQTGKVEQKRATSERVCVYVLLLQKGKDKVFATYD